MEVIPSHRSVRTGRAPINLRYRNLRNRRLRSGGRLATRSSADPSALVRNHKPHVGNTAVHIREDGPPNGQPVLLIHGLPVRFAGLTGSPQYWVAGTARCGCWLCPSRSRAPSRSVSISRCGSRPPVGRRQIRRGKSVLCQWPQRPRPDAAVAHLHRPRTHKHVHGFCRAVRRICLRARTARRHAGNTPRRRDMARPTQGLRPP